LSTTLVYPNSITYDFGLKVEWLGSTCLLTLDRPRKLNAMSSSFFHEFGTVVDQIVAVPELRSVVVTGAGGNFSAGGDIATFDSLDSPAAFERHLQTSFGALRSIGRIPVPTIAAVEGIAFAGGLEMSAACDFIVAGQGARFALSEASVGLLPAVGLRHLGRVIGEKRAKWLGLTSEPISAETAHEWGLVHAVVPSGVAVSAALEVAAKFDTLPSEAVRAIKSFIDNPDQTLDDAVSTNIQLMQDPAHVDAVTKFLTKGRSAS
jgi:enoyl-CoA hydratase/carnithine racemase